MAAAVHFAQIFVVLKILKIMKISLSLIALSIPFLFPLSAQAYPLCENDIRAEPSAEVRVIELGSTEFSIPSNYRASRLADGSVEVLDPSTFAYLECVREVGVGVGGWDSIRVELTSVDVGAQGWVRATGLLGSEFVQVLAMERGEADGMATGTIHSAWKFDGAHADYFQDLPTGGSIRVSAVNPDAFGGVFEAIAESIKPKD
jgi:hypothetical protein